MKKKLLSVLSILIISSTLCSAYSKTMTSSELSSAIQLYKQGNYSQCYLKLENIIKKDPANALAYYYMAMTSAQIGRKDEAISNYEKVIMLTPNNNLNRYATKGKRCLETPDKCEESMYDSQDDEFINSKNKSAFSEEVKSEYERLRIENLMREMNRSDDINPQRFKQYKDFSSVPTNDEIVDALRTLQRAGFGNIMNGNYADLSILTGNNAYQNQNQMMNIMGVNSMNPQLIQALLTNSMTQGF